MKNLFAHAIALLQLFLRPTQKVVVFCKEILYDAKYQQPTQEQTMITTEQLKRREQLIALAFLALMLSPFFIL